MSKPKNRMNFWSPEARELLVAHGRQDIIDSGDALAERVTALVLTAVNRLEKYTKDGDLYCEKGGQDLISQENAVGALDEFVSVRLRSEIDALEHLLEVFDDFQPQEPPKEDNIFGLPPWYLWYRIPDGDSYEQR